MRNVSKFYWRCRLWLYLYVTSSLKTMFGIKNISGYEWVLIYKIQSYGRNK